MPVVATAAGSVDTATLGRGVDVHDAHPAQGATERGDLSRERGVHKPSLGTQRPP